MTRRRGRPRKGELADMTIYPVEEAGCFEPPPEEDTEKITYTIQLAAGHKAGVVQTFRRDTDRLVNFSVWQSIYEDGRWNSVMRIDSWHGEVHRHDFTRTGDNHRTVLEIVPNDHREDVIGYWCDRGEDFIMTEWEQNVRRWHGD